jgi:hypothetical protein
MVRNVKNASSGMLRRVVLVRTDVSEESITSVIRVTRIRELGTTLTATSNRSTTSSVLRLLVAVNVVPRSLILVTLMIEEIRSSGTIVLIWPLGVTSQKLAFFVATIVKTSNLT